MNSQSRSYYKRFYRLVAVAVAVMTSVLTGSLILGDSVRGSLVERVDERLRVGGRGPGIVETLIQTGTGFLSDTILTSPLLSDAKGFLMAEGFISSNGQMIPVTVWGSDVDSLKPGEVLINETLHQYLSPNTQSPIPEQSSPTRSLSPVILHLPSNNLVGSGSLFVSQSYATQLRLDVKGVKSRQDGGNLLLRQEQVRPKNIFMNRQELAEALGIKGKINVIFSPKQISEDQFNAIWKPEFSGLTITSCLIGTDRIFLPQAVVAVLNPSARYLAYFVNSLGDIPYSFVTATDQLQGDETILTDYTARRLNAHVGDSVTMEYYVSRGGLKQLEARSHRFRVSRIEPISEFQQQSDLITADFPGLSGVNRCTDWDSDLPIDMSRITKVDEDYWADYRQLPKALVSLDAVGHDWIGSYGVATKVVTPSLLTPSLLTPSSFGIAVVQPRAAALRAAQNGTDFGLLFLALGFFIIIAAVLLMLNPLSEMYQLRRPEIRTFKVLGFSQRQLFSRLFTETLPVVFLAAPIGVLLGYAYAAMVLWLLGGPWSGATHTDGFTLHAHPLTVGISLVVTIVLVLLVLFFAVRSGLRSSFALVKGQKSKAALDLSPQTLDNRTFRLLPEGRKNFHVSMFNVQRSTLHYYRRQHHLSFWTLALGVLIVFAIGMNRPDSSHTSEEATGGYQYYGESRIPIQYDLNTAAGRHHLHLNDLPADTRFLQMPKHTEDEASCLNLNKVETPSVLGMSPEDMKAFGIDLPSEGVAVDEEALLWSLMKQVGDTLTYHASDGQTVKVVIAASYPTGILHGNAIMPLSVFRQLWPDETGSRIFLTITPLDLRIPEQSPPIPADAPARSLSPITQALSDYGVTIVPTAERMSQFFEVTDTYLSIFLSLGGLGLLLGLVSLLIVIRKNLTARREEIRLYHTLGFPTETVVAMLRREQMVVPLLAVVAGMLGNYAVSCLLAITQHPIPITHHLTPTALVLFIAILLFTWIIIHFSINSKTIQQCETF